MTTKKKVRDDLNEIRFYYSKKELFDITAKELKSVALLEKVKKYNAVMEQAPANLFIVYVSLYMNNNTQEALADDWDYSQQYISYLNVKLVEFLCSQI